MTNPSPLQNSFLPKLPAWGEDDTQLPRWAYSEKIAYLAHHHGNDHHFVNGVPPLTCTSGPGVKLGFCALANLWIFFCVAPLIAYHRSSCPEDKGFARCDDSVMYVLLVIVWLIGVWLEKMAMSHVILSHLAAEKRFVMFGFCFNRFPYHYFAIFKSGAMLFAFLDVMTNAETLGKTLRTAHCDSYESISRLWNITLKESTLQHVPGFHGADFVNICFFAYLFMLAQPIFALMYSVPIERGVNYEAAFGEEYRFEYKTIYHNSGTNHGAVLQVLAVATRMEAVVHQNVTYVKHRMKTWEQIRGNNWEERYIRLADVALIQGITRFFLVGLFQSAIQVNLQITLMALTTEATRLQDNQLLFSAIMSLLFSLGDFPDACEVFVLAWSAQRKLSREGFSPDSEESYRATVKHEISNVRWKLVRFILYMFLYAGWLLYAWAKLWGYFMCPDHLFNLNGCVVS